MKLWQKQRWCWLMMSWWNLKLITEQRDDQNPNLQSIFSLGHQWCWSSKANCLTYNEVFGFFLDKDLVSANQSGFKPEDSYINQLLSITHDICKSFDDGYEIRVFSLIFQKHLIKFGMMVLYSNYKKMKYRVYNLLKVLKHFFDK